MRVSDAVLPPILMVEWDDATGGNRSGWRALKSLLGPPEKVISVGFAIRDDDVITLVPHKAGDEGDGEISIPRIWATAVTVLVPSRKKYGGHVGLGTVPTLAPAGSR